MANNNIIPNNISIDQHFIPPTPHEMNSDPKTFESPSIVELGKSLVGAAVKGYQVDLEYIKNLQHENVRLGNHQHVYKHEQITLEDIKNIDAILTEGTYVLPDKTYGNNSHERYQNYLNEAANNPKYIKYKNFLNRLEILLPEKKNVDFIALRDRKTDQPYVAARGNDFSRWKTGPRDAYMDTSIIRGKIPNRYKTFENFINDLKHDYPLAKKNIHMTGHSGGGFLVKEYCKSHPNTTCVTFESPNRHFLNGGKTYSNLIEYKNTGDLISFGQSEGNEVHRIVPSASGSNYLKVLNNHSIKQYTDSIDTSHIAGHNHHKGLPNPIIHNNRKLVHPDFDPTVPINGNPVNKHAYGRGLQSIPHSDSQFHPTVHKSNPLNEHAYGKGPPTITHSDSQFNPRDHIMKSDKNFSLSNHKFEIGHESKFDFDHNMKFDFSNESKFDIGHHSNLDFDPSSKFNLGNHSKLDLQLNLGDHKNLITDDHFRLGNDLHHHQISIGDHHIKSYF